MNEILLAIALSLTAGMPKQDTQIDNQQQVPLVVEAITRNGRPATYILPPVFSVAPPSAGVVTGSMFIPDDVFVGPVVVTVDAVNRKNDPITGSINITVSEAPAVALVITAGTPVDK